MELGISWLGRYGLPLVIGFILGYLVGKRK